jgi:lipid-A-disaccharide synthase-like uncharacterized protein
MLDIFSDNGKLPRIFALIMLVGVVMTTIITYFISIQQQINVSYVKGTLNQSVTNFEINMENNNLLKSINHTLTTMATNGK